MNSDNQPTWNDVIIFFIMAIFVGIMTIVIFVGSR